jgi:23S rRNA pseudouridine1911/1915/1917 synthase
MRTIVVTREEAGQPVAALLKRHLRLSWSQARRLVEQNRVRQGPRLCRDAQGRVRAGQKLRVRLDDKPPPKKRPAPPGPRLTVRQVDADIVVVEKPPGLTTMRHTYEAAEFGKRGRRFLPPTLADLLPETLAARGAGRGRVIAVHRLDRDTSGLVLFARTAGAARHLGEQFRKHTVERTYLALVRGRAKNERVESSLVPDRGDGRRGSGPPDEGQRTVTNVRVVEQVGEFTLVECRLETGRTHQVRIHLGERGTPICGERVYDRPPHGAPLPDRSGAERLALHAASLTVVHPRTGQRMTWKSPLPADLQDLLKRMRRQAK